MPLRAYFGPALQGQRPITVTRVGTALRVVLVDVRVSRRHVLTLSKFRRPPGQ